MLQAPFFGFLRPVTIIGVVTIAVLAPAAAWSQTATATKIVITFPARGGGDLLTRAMAEQVTRAHGQEFIFENADPVAGTESVSRATPNGKTLLVLNNNFTIDPKLQKPPYDPLTSFIPICNLASGPLLIVVDAASPYRTLDDLLAAARDKPGQVVVTGGLGLPQIAVEMLKGAAKVDIKFAPAANAAAITALAAQRATAAVQLYPNVREQLKANKLHALAITSRTRRELLPDVPAVAEAGLAGYEAEYWDGIYAPAGTPKETVDQLADWFGTAARTPEAKDVLTAQTYAPVGVCGRDFVLFIRKELDEFGRIAREANIAAQ
jgi:tripartite-type tricarboxylate transporter receptor subunit TctC